MLDSNFTPVTVNRPYSFAGQEQKEFGIETVHKCNARCVFCCFGHYEKHQVTNVFTGETWFKEKKLMDWKLIEAIFQRHRPELFIMTGQSEPFLDPRIPEILALGKIYKPFNLAIFSNANMMTKEVLDKIIPDRQFYSINFSLNALTDATRQDIMGISYEEGKKKILMFLEKRREYLRETQFNAVDCSSDEKQNLRVGVSFIAAQGMYNGKLVSNLHEIEPFKKEWNEILRQYHCNWEVGVFPAGNWGGAIPREMMIQEMREVNPNGCGQWDCTGPTIDVDGQIMLCCYNSRWSFGSCLDDAAMARWHARREILGVQGSVLHSPLFCENSSYRFVPTRWSG